MLASGVTAIAGFGVLVLSNITMLRDFGFVTLVDLSVSLAGVLLVLPAVLVLAEREDAVARVRAAARRAGMALPRRAPPRARSVSERPLEPEAPEPYRLDPDRAVGRRGRGAAGLPVPHGDRHPALPLDDRDLRDRAGDR